MSVMKKAGFIRWRAVIQKRCRRSICAGDSRFSQRIHMCWEAFCSAFRMPDTVITAERPTVLPSAIGGIVDVEGKPKQAYAAVKQAIRDYYRK